MSDLPYLLAQIPADLPAAERALMEAAARRTAGAPPLDVGAVAKLRRVFCDLPATVREVRREAA